MTVKVIFWSYFADLAGTKESAFDVAERATVDQLIQVIYLAHPKLAGLRNSTLVAVGVEYQGGSHVLKPGDSVSLFPPVQGG